MRSINVDFDPSMLQWEAKEQPVFQATAWPAWFACVLPSPQAWLDSNLQPDSDAAQSTGIKKQKADDHVPAHMKKEIALAVEEATPDYEYLHSRRHALA